MAVQDLVRFEDRADGRWIMLSGELDHEGCARVGDRLREAASAAKTARVIVDMSDVSFVASQGLRLLLQVQNALKNAGRTLQIGGMRPNIRRVMETTGILQAIPEWTAPKP